MKARVGTNYQQSRELASEGKWEKAFSKIKLCLNEEPENRKYQKLFKQITRHQEVSFKIEEARELEKCGNFEQAIETYRDSLETKTGYSKKIKTLIKEACKRQQEFEDFYQQAQHLYQQEKYTKAKNITRCLISMTPHNQAMRELVQEIENKEQAQILYSEAMALYKRSQFHPALKKVVQSLELNRDFAAAHILLAKIGTTQTCRKYQLDETWKNKKKLQDAIQLLEGSIEVDDD